eukprot:16430581-Heterocapsa_arctica.AAC.1
MKFFLNHLAEFKHDLIIIKTVVTSLSIPDAMWTICEAESFDEASPALHHWPASCPWYKVSSLCEIHDTASKESCIILHDESLLSDQMFMGSYARLPRSPACSRKSRFLALAANLENFTK